jgi:hypothetical protein
MRVCGGWVRDKLLQKDNDDIDICLDTCSGQEFTTELKAWFDSKDQSSLCSTVGIIKASTEKSKHLETAVIRITVTGEDVPEDTVVSLDFVQLRSEVYAENSRHPIVKCATPEEDATRRDFTINSMYIDGFYQQPLLVFNPFLFVGVSMILKHEFPFHHCTLRFYNIQNKTVEDFTGHGINDLRRGIIRTPIDAVRTLQDDPLRALRAIRFQYACAFGELCFSHRLLRGRFNFVLDQGLIDGLRDPEVKRKLTSVRVGAHYCASTIIQIYFALQHSSLAKQHISFTFLSRCRSSVVSESAKRFLGCSEGQVLPLEPRLFIGRNSN